LLQQVDVKYRKSIDAIFYTGSAKKYIHILRDVVHVLIFELDLNYGCKF